MIRGKRKLVDCFMFFDTYETNMLISRLNYLAPIVDYFLVVEGMRSFSGVPKPKPIFRKLVKDLTASGAIKDLSDKIHCFNTERVEITNIDENTWRKERDQRECLGILVDMLYRDQSINDRDLLILSDIDEIPNRDVIKQLAITEARVLEQDFYYYNFNWRKKAQWYGSIVIDAKSYSDIGNTEDLRKLRTKLPVLKNGGWHCSYFAPPRAIQKKLQSFSHSEYNRLPYTSLAHIEDCVQQGKDLFDRDLLIPGEEMIPNTAEEIAKLYGLFPLL